MKTANERPPQTSATRIALVTGASKGLGRALADALAAEGWTLVLDARGGEALARAAAEIRGRHPGATVHALPGDVTNATHRQALVETLAMLGGVDLVVNNAGALGPSPLPPLVETPIDALEEVYRANVLAPLALVQAVRPLLRERAAIVQITSDAGVEAYPGWGGYGSSKAALEHLSRVLAVENPGLRVYTVDPGDMRTEMHQAAFPGEDISDRELPEASVPGILALVNGDHPSGRYLAKQVSAGVEVTP